MVCNIRLIACISTLFLSFFSLNGQSVDSLKQALRLSRPDTQRVNLLLALASEYRDNERDTAIYYAGQAMQLGKTLKWKPGEAGAHYELAMVYRKDPSGDEAVKHFQLSAKKYEEAKAFSGKAEALRRLGYLFGQLGEYPQAEATYTEGLASADLARDEEIAAKLHSGFSGLYRLMGNYDQSVKHGILAMDIQERLGDMESLTFTLDRLGVVYKLMEDYPKALRYYRRALELRESFAEPVVKDLAYSAMVIGETYAACDSLDMAIVYLNNALKYYKEADQSEGLGYANHQLAEVSLRLGQTEKAMGYLEASELEFGKINNARGILNNAYLWTSIYLNKEDWNSALRYGLKFYTLANEIGSQNHRTNARFFLYRIYKERGDLKQALFFHEHYLEVKDSLWNENKGAEIARLESNMTVEKAKRENELLLLSQKVGEETLRRQQNWVMFLVCLLVMGILGGLWIYYMWHKEQKLSTALSYKEKELQAQKHALLMAEADLLSINENLEEIVLLRTEELNSSNKKLGEFAYLASHDLKYPLRTLRGYAQILDKELQKPAPGQSRIKECIHYIEGGIDYMNQLIDNILKQSQYTRYETSNYQSILISDVVQQVRHNLQRQIVQSGAQLEVNVAPVPIIAARHKIEQMVQNLLANCLKYRVPKGQLTISIELVNHPDEVVLIITDDGDGIPAEVENHVFSVFQKGAKTYKANQMGVGLTISKKIAEQHGGDIHLVSRPGQGTTFKVTLKKDPTKSEILSQIA
jgi:two-component system, NtrC family, sensor kinase